MCEGSRDQGVEIGGGGLEWWWEIPAFAYRLQLFFWFINVDSAMGP